MPEHRPAPRRPERDGERVRTGPPGSLSDAPEERLGDRFGLPRASEDAVRNENAAPPPRTTHELRVPPSDVAR